MAEPRKRPTKAELRERDLRAVLAWPTQPEPTPLTEAQTDEMVGSWDAKRVVPAWTYNVGRGDVCLGCFATNSHNGWADSLTALNGSKGRGGPWFMTREEACLALTWATTRELAAKLQTLQARLASIRATPLPARAPENAG